MVQPPGQAEGQVHEPLGGLENLTECPVRQEDLNDEKIHQYKQIAKKEINKK
jgi:hypothetical protein